MTKQSGATLIEVMVTMVILGLGLLGLGGMQSRVVVMNQSAYYRSIAADLAADLASRIQVIRTPMMVSTDANPKPGKPPNFSKCTQNADAVTCADQDSDRNTYQSLVNSQMGDWLSSLRAQLPGATYTLTSASSSSTDYFRYTLTITWTDNRQDNSTTSYVLVIE